MTNKEKLEAIDEFFQFISPKTSYQLKHPILVKISKKMVISITSISKKNGNVYVHFNNDMTMGITSSDLLPDAIYQALITIKK